MNVFWNCLTFKTDILLNWFCMFISDLIIKLRFEQFNVRFCWFLTPSLQYLVLEFADTWPWMSLKSPWIWLFLTYVRTLAKHNFHFLFRLHKLVSPRNGAARSMPRVLYNTLFLFFWKLCQNRYIISFNFSNDYQVYRPILV